MIPVQRTTFGFFLLFSGCSAGLMGAPGREMVRTELYFGMTRLAGADVTPGEFEAFMEQIVAPRFPQGHTVIEAQGRWREQTGTLRTEPTRVLIVLHAGDRPSHQKLEEIRDAYKSRFAQEAVMRVDDQEKVAF